MADKTPLSDPKGWQPEVLEDETYDYGFAYAILCGTPAPPVIREDGLEE